MGLEGRHGFEIQWTTTHHSALPQVYLSRSPCMSAFIGPLVCALNVLLLPRTMLQGGEDADLIQDDEGDDDF